jgi:hypothetical protein
MFFLIDILFFITCTVIHNLSLELVHNIYTYARNFSIYIYFILVHVDFSSVPSVMDMDCCNFDLLTYVVILQRFLTCSIATV